jgi:uncharacterized protein YdaU (DUF1376 family)
MAKESSAWMPLYVGDYLGDTQRLTTEQHGAYLLLILDYWRNGPAPDDDDVLQQITKLDRLAWKRHRPALARMFKIDGGEWHHKRIDKELASAADNAERRSSKARAAAQARWTDAPSNAQSNATGNAASTAPSNAPSMPEAMLGGCPPQSPSSDTSVSADFAPKLDLDDRPAEPAPDPVKALFDAGVSLLTEAGSSPTQARSLIGKWRQAHGDEAVMGGIVAARRQAVSDPRSWITQRLRARVNTEDPNETLYRLAARY